MGEDEEEEDEEEDEEEEEEEEEDDEEEEEPDEPDDDIVGRCVDSPLPMFSRNGPKDCEWVAEKAMKRCSKLGVSAHCPFTCGRCEDLACEDSGRKFVVVGNQTRKCRYFAKKPSKRCISNDINATCRKSCGFCNSSSSSTTEWWE